MRILILLTGLLVLMACEKQTSWELQTADTNTLIVDGIITNEFKKQQIRLTYSGGSTKEAAIPVSGASVIVDGKIRTFIFEEKVAGSGLYESTIPFSGNIKTNYRLTIVNNGKTYYADAEMIPVTPLLKMEYELVDEKDSLYKIKYIASSYNEFTQVMYEIDIDWSFLPRYDSLPDDSCKAKLFYYTLSSIDISQFFTPAAEKLYFPKGALVKERKYSITKEHEAFLRSLLFETTWRGGYFDEAPANVRTNLSNGAFGFFGACAVAERTDYIK